MVLFTTPIAPQAGDALLIINVQHDFLASGSRPVLAAETVVAPLNACIAQFAAAHLPVFATRECPRPDHCSFHAPGGPSAADCVEGTAGAQFPAELKLPAATHVISKTAPSHAEISSGFANTDLHQQLQRHAVRRLFVGGLVTDCGVLYTVLDALRLGYGVMLLLDCVRPIDARSGDGERAIAAMLAAGATAATATRP